MEHLQNSININLLNYINKEVLSMYFYLYRIVNKVNNKLYIGVHKTENLDDGYMGSGKLIKRAVAKYGVDNFQKTILEFFSSSKEMYERESVVVDKDFIESGQTYNLSLGGRGCDLSSSPARKENHRVQSIKQSPSCKDKTSEDYRTWYLSYVANAPNLQEKDSEAFLNWMKGRQNSFPHKGEEAFTEWIKTHPQLHDRSTDTYKKWYEELSKNAPHLQDKNTEEFLCWKRATVASLPQTKPKDSDEYKQWYRAAMSTHASCQPKDSEQYQNWYAKIMAGKLAHKKMWVYNDTLQVSRTVNVDTELEDGWFKGRRFYNKTTIKLGQEFEL